jgi:hypothetical protein
MIFHYQKHTVLNYSLVAMEPLETGPFETAALPPFEPGSNEAGTDREEAALEESRDPTARPRAGPRSGGVDPTARCPARERGSIGVPLQQMPGFGGSPPG